MAEENKKEKAKFNKDKVEEAAQALEMVRVTIEKYEDIWRTLTQQEKAIVGGIVFNLVCIWKDFSLVGVLADRSIGATLINRLADFFNSPPPKPGGIPPSITPVGGGQGLPS